MNLSKVIFKIIIIVFISLLISCNKQAEDSNILLIVVDDLGYADMSHTGLAEDVNTPNIDQLAENGTRFTKAYATSPICSPSRAGLITGCYQQRWGTFWYGGNGLHKTEYQTIPEILKQKDYSTGYIGKVHYGKHDNDTSHRSFPLNHGFDYFFGHTSARKHYLNHVSEIEDQFIADIEKHNKKGQSLRQGALWDNYDQIDTVAFSTELFGKKACDFINSNKKEPFFLQLSFNAVHNFTHQLPENYLKENSLKGYHDWDPNAEDYREWYVQGRYPNNPEGREHYLGQLHFLDQEIGRVMDCLKENRLIDNTLVIFISDNGGSTPIYANNHPLRGSKYTCYEGGLRVPMIISYPENYQRGKISDNRVSALDILPTICDAAGIEIPDYIDGMNISPILDGTDESIEHEVLFWNTKQEKVVVENGWKYTHTMKDWSSKYEMVELELGEFLYNLKEDIGEENNLIKEYPEKYEELKAEVNAWIESLKE